MVLKEITRYPQRLFIWVWHFISEPFEHLPKTEDHRRAVVSAVFLLFSAISIAIEQMMAGNTPFIALVLMVVGYFLARTRWFKFATAILVITLSFPSYLVALNLPNPDTSRINSAFGWIIIPLLLSSLIYSIRTMVAFSLINIAALVSLPFIRPALDFGMMGGALGFYGLTSIILIIVMIQRNEIENDRQRELVENRNQLSEEVAQRKLFAEQSQRQARELSLLGTVQNTLASELDIDMLLQTIVVQIADAFGYTFVSLYMIEDDHLQLKHQVGYVPEQVIEKIPLDTGVSGRVINTGRSLLIQDVSLEPDFLRASSNIQSEVCVPLYDGNEICGILNLESSIENPLNENDLRLMNALAVQINVAIRRARLFFEREESLKHEQHINDFAHTLSNTLDLPSILERGAKVSVALTNAEAGTVSLMSEDGSEITDVYYSNQDMEISVIAPKGYGLTWLVYEKGRAIIVDEYSAHPNAVPEWAKMGLQAYMGTPIFAGGKNWV